MDATVHARIVTSMFNARVSLWTNQIKKSYLIEKSETACTRVLILAGIRISIINTNIPLPLLHTATYQRYIYSTMKDVVHECTIYLLFLPRSSRGSLCPQSTP